MVQLSNLKIIFTKKYDLTFWGINKGTLKESFIFIGLYSKKDIDKLSKIKRNWVFLNDITGLTPVYQKDNYFESDSNRKFETLEVNQATSIKTINLIDIKCHEFYLIYSNAEGRIQKKLVSI